MSPTVIGSREHEHTSVYRGVEYERNIQEDVGQERGVRDVRLITERVSSLSKETFVV